MGGAALAPDASDQQQAFDGGRRRAEAVFDLVGNRPDLVLVGKLGEPGIKIDANL
jgi:hypothetical protein